MAVLYLARWRYFLKIIISTRQKKSLTSISDTTSMMQNVGTINKHMKQLLFCTILILLPSIFLGQQAGILDFSFDSDGLLINSPGNVEDRAYGIAVQQDGKIVISGISSLINDCQSLVSRYQADGTIDSTFGLNGHQILNLQPGTCDNFHTVIIQSNDKIIVCGPSGNNFPFSVNIARLFSDGSLDSSFGTNGVQTYYGPTGSFYPTAMIQDTLGRTVISGTTSNNMVLLRLLPDGSPDSSFNSDGFTIPLSIGVSTLSYGLTIDQYSNIVVAGSDQGGSNYAITRFDTNGNLDSTFGSNGFALYPLTGFGSLHDCKVQNDGKIIACGSFDATGIGNNHDFIIVRANANGSVDSSFANNGVFELPLSPKRDILQSILIQPDGKIIAAGSAQQDFSTSDFAIVRLDSSGILDNNFGTNGIVITDFNSNLDVGSKIVIQPDLKLIVCGWTLQNNKWNVALARYYSGLPTSISQLSLNNLKFQVYPNPATDYLNIHLNSNDNLESIQIFNISGQQIKNVDNDDIIIREEVISIDINYLPAGMYFIKFNGNRTQTAKFIKTNNSL